MAGVVGTATPVVLVRDVVSRDVADAYPEERFERTVDRCGAIARVSTYDTCRAGAARHPWIDTKIAVCGLAVGHRGWHRAPMNFFDDARTWPPGTFAIHLPDSNRPDGKICLGANEHHQHFPSDLVLRRLAAAESR
jgi:hypothetical protein